MNDLRPESYNDWVLLCRAYHFWRGICAERALSADASAAYYDRVNASFGCTTNGQASDNRRAEAAKLRAWADEVREPFGALP